MMEVSTFTTQGTLLLKYLSDSLQPALIVI